MRSLFLYTIRGWAPVALLCQALLVAFAIGPVAPRPQTVALASEAGPQCLQAGLPLFSGVLGAASRNFAVAPTSTPQPAARPTPPMTPAPLPPTPAPPAATPERAPVQRAIAPPRPPPRPPAVAQATATPALAPVDGCERIIALVNQVRHENGLTPLAYNPQLTAAAQQYADFLAAHNLLNHTADGRTLDTRAEAAGYTTWVALGENLAGGYATFEEALDAWIASLAHRDNILNPGFVETGVSCVWNAGSAYGSFFVQEFGTRS